MLPRHMLPRQLLPRPRSSPNQNQNSPSVSLPPSPSPLTPHPSPLTLTPYLELIKELRISNTLYICFCIERDIPGFQKSKISSNSLSSVSHNRLTSSLQDACWKLKNSSFWTLLTNFYIYKINLKKKYYFHTNELHDL